MYFQHSNVDETRKWLRALQIASREPWAKEGSCSQCAAPFDLVSRQHHCRRCGVVACERCSANKQAMLDYGYPEPVRVCKSCYGEYGPVPPASERAARAAAKAEEAEARTRAEAEEKVARAKQSRNVDADDRKARLREQLKLK